MLNNISFDQLGISHDDLAAFIHKYSVFQTTQDQPSWTNFFNKANNRMRIFLLHLDRVNAIRNSKYVLIKNSFHAVNNVEFHFGQSPICKKGKGKILSRGRQANNWHTMNDGTWFFLPSIGKDMDFVARTD
jgi:hypothetical protein